MAVLIFGIFCTRVFAKGPFRRPLSLRACGPRVLRWKTLRVSSAPHPGGFESLCTGPEKGKASSDGGLTIQWWAMRDVRVRLVPPAPRFVAPLLACCAGKRFAFPQLRTLSGSNPSAMGPKMKGPHSWEPIKSVVGDEGCRVRLTPPAFASGLRPSRAALENASRFLSFAPCRVRIPCAGPKQKRSPCEDRFQFNGGR